MVLAEMSRKPLLIYAAIAATALAVGYFLTSPLDLMSFAGLLGVVAFLLLPVMLTWHHALLVFSWNACVIVFFLPSAPPLWMLFVFISLIMAVGTSLLAGRVPYPPARPVSTALVLLTLVVVGTGFIRGGFGVAALGSESFGGKAYIHILAAVAGYFALAATPVTPQRAEFYGGLFVLSGITAAASHLIYFLGEKFYFFYFFFPAELVIPQAVAEHVGSRMVRFTGLGLSCVAIAQFMMMRYGIKGLLNLSHPFRLLAYLAAFAFGLLSGFRSLVILLVVLFLMQSYFERLLFTRMFFVLLLVGLLGGAFLVPFSSSLPLSIQRSLSILPLELEPSVRADADASTEWRVQMWKLLLPDLPKYVFLGKGYAINPAELALSRETVRRGLGDPALGAIVAGDYHNGPLSVYIPLGSMGLLAFILFLALSVRMLYRQHRHGDQALQRLNTFLLAAFVTQIIMFTFVFGALSKQLWTFTGIIGMSVCLNRGAWKTARQQQAASQEPAPLPAWIRRGRQTEESPLGPEAGLASPGRP